ncbi:hypothetical protein BGW38_002582 [Lunasporangiospora selenospora]|uniref:Uncharacterized protein n=1 Tax=Lunasporangiospora selenospora TaxID=979761 RepID=A0A9P6KDA1_9FUNG|nr:hypothetical protein BGW38_002582 [Lunasporangiospora selenospora]
MTCYRFRHPHVCDNHNQKDDWCAWIEPYTCTHCRYEWRIVVLNCEACGCHPPEVGLESKACSFVQSHVSLMRFERCIRCDPMEGHSRLASFYDGLRTRIRRGFYKLTNVMDIAITPMGHGGPVFHAPRTTELLIFLPDNEVVRRY